jgi:DNA invertase Pin-like site-specific DNA recombinase
MLGIYCRTSKSRKEKYTLETQKAGGLKCAKELGLDYQFYIDDGITGTKDESVRDGLGLLFSDMKKGKITAIYCFDQSRIERNTEIWDIFSIQCLSYDVKFYLAGNFYDLEDPALRMVAQMMSITNNFSTIQTSIKVKDANARKAADGKTHGLISYGYKKGDGNMYEIDENEAQYVRLMFEMSIDGKGSYTISKYLNSQNVPTKYSGNFKDKGVITRRNKYTKELVEFKKKEVIWRGNVISDILKNPIYKGDRIWNVHKDKIDIVDGKKVKSKVIVETIVGKVPAIVSEELWNQVQANFKKNKKESVGKKAQYHYLLNGLIFCERCGNSYWGKKRLKGNDNAYKCLSKTYPNAKCDNRGLSLPKLETFVIQYLQKEPISNQVLNNLPVPKKLIDKHIELRNKKKKEIENLSKAIRALSNQLEKSNIIKEVLEKIDSMNNKRQFLLDDIAVLDKKIIEEENSNPSETEIKESRKKISTVTKINADFADIRKTVFQLVDWISIEYVNDKSPAFFMIKIKLKGQSFVDEYMADYHLNKWTQKRCFISKLKSQGVPMVNLSRTSDFDLKHVLNNLLSIKLFGDPPFPKKTTNVSQRPHPSNDILINVSDIYNFD